MCADCIKRKHLVTTLSLIFPHAINTKTAVFNSQAIKLKDVQTLGRSQQFLLLLTGHGAKTQVVSGTPVPCQSLVQFLDDIVAIQDIVYGEHVSWHSTEETDHLPVETVDVYL